MALVKRRLPPYLNGLFLGLVIAVIWYTGRTAFAPKFHEVNTTIEKRILAPNSKIVIKYAQNPEHHIAYGFPSSLYVGKESSPGGQISTTNTLEYRDLVNQEVAIGPWTEPGNYEARMVLYTCEKPGDADCLKKSYVIPFTVDAKTAAGDSIVEIDLLSK